MGWFYGFGCRVVEKTAMVSVAADLLRKAASLRLQEL